MLCTIGKETGLISVNGKILEAEESE